MPSGQPTGDRIVWDDANEKHLLLCILASAKPSGLDWADISARFGRSLSSGAASQKFAKIKNRDKELVEEGGTGTPSTSKGKKVTPAKSSAQAKRKVNEVAKKATHAAEESADEEHAASEEPETPSKKPKHVKQDVESEVSLW